MSDPTMETAKPVFIYYDETAEPDELHPAGMHAGSMFECPTPELAMQFHPKARIIRYVDGSDYHPTTAKRELKEREELEEREAADRKAARNARRRAQRGDKRDNAAQARRKAPTRRASAKKVSEDAKADDEPQTAEEAHAEIVQAAEAQVAKLATDAGTESSNG